MDPSTAVVDSWSTAVNKRNLFIVVCLFCLAFIVRQAESGYSLKDVEVPATVNGKTVYVFTSEEIGKYDGSDQSKPIYMGIKGVVFDVSSGKRFYGKGSAYNSLVGKDCTRAVAKMSLDEKDLTHDVTGLSDDHLQSLDETFESTYIAKYPVAGYMDYFVKQHPHKFAEIDIKTEL